MKNTISRKLGKFKRQFNEQTRNYIWKALESLQWHHGIDAHAVIFRNRRRWRRGPSARFTKHNIKAGINYNSGLAEIQVFPVWQILLHVN